MTHVIVATIQMSCCPDSTHNLEKAEHFVRQAASKGATIILLPELFETIYFCKDQNEAFFALAHSTTNSPLIKRFSALAKRLKVVLPISFFERANTVFYNAVAVINADGCLLGIYRKIHIPDGPGYQEKFYFTPGDTGFKVWSTYYGRIGIGICWDQWFPEVARGLALQGANLLFFPSAIGSEPATPSLDSCAHWQRVMQGQAAANLIPIIVANRTGQEIGQSCAVTFYGSSFITDVYGEILACAGRTEETLLTARFDLDAIQTTRTAWGVFRDRRPSHYHVLLTSDGLG